MSAESRELRRELGLPHLVLTQVLCVVGSTWVGVAAKLGNQQIVFWLLAMLTFYLPLAAVVIYLNRLMPLEGGLYQWAKAAFGEFVGFITAWNLWLYTILLVSSFGLVVANNISYAVGPAGKWMQESKPFVMGITGGLVVGLVVITILGLRVGKWVHSVGGATLTIAFLVLIALPLVGLAQGTIAEFHPFAVEMPSVSLFSLNIFGKLALGALSGFEYVAILAGECKDPARSIGRSVMIATPVIALMFILGTSSVLAFVPPKDVDLIGPIPQVLTLGFSSFGFASVIAPIAILMLLGRQIGNVSYVFTGTTRLLVVAGWDDLLPAWFTRLHAKYRTPVNSTLFVGAVMLALGLVGQIGVGQQEAFQLLENACGIFYSLTYLVLFAVPLVGLRGVRTPIWLKVASVSGFLMSLLYTVLSVWPIIDVENPFVFAAKISAVIVVANVVGASIYVLARRRASKRAALSPEVARAGSQSAD